MELLEIIFYVVWWLIEGLVATGDVYSWNRGKENRIERREARKRGLPPPPRDKWNNWVIVLTVLFVVLTASFVAWRL
jgi:hypothetical protein